METQKAFSTLEYATLIAVVVAALLVMGIYIRRAVCGKWKDAADSFGFGRQYDTATTTQTCYDQDGKLVSCP